MPIESTLLPVRGDDAVDILENDHAVIKRLLDDLIEAGGSQKQQVVQRLVGVLTIHNATEENLVYPALNKVAGSKLEAQHLYHETAEADTLLFELDSMLKERDEYEFSAKVQSFATAVRGHINEEERKAFPRLRENADSQHGKLLTDSVRAFRAALRFELPQSSQ